MYIPSQQVLVRFPSEQLMRSGGEEDVPGTVADLVPCVGEELLPHRHSKGFQAVGATASQLLVIWQRLMKEKLTERGKPREYMK